MDRPARSPRRPEPERPLTTARRLGRARTAFVVSWIDRRPGWLAGRSPADFTRRSSYQQMATRSSSHPLSRTRRALKERDDEDFGDGGRSDRFNDAGAADSRPGPRVVGPDLTL